MKKRFVARVLIPVLEKIIAEGYSPFTAETRASAPIIPEHDEQIEALIEQSRQHKIVYDIEPPPDSSDSTISDVIERARDPETSQRIQESLFGEPLVQNPDKLLRQQYQQFNPHPPEEDKEPTPAENALNTDPDQVLDVIRQQAQGTPVEAPDSISQIMEALTPPDDLPVMQPIDPLPVNEETFSFRPFIPPP